MAETAPRPAILISRVLPEESLRLARSRADVDLHSGDRPLPREELVARLYQEIGQLKVELDWLKKKVGDIE